MVIHVLRLDENRVRRDELTAKTLRITQNRPTKWVLPFFEHIPIHKIDYLLLESFIEELTEIKLKGVAISQYLIIVRKVLNYALLTNLLTSLPQFPRVKTPRVSHGPFTIQSIGCYLKQPGGCETVLI